MSRSLLIDCGAAQIIGILLKDQEPVKFWFEPALGDEVETHEAVEGDRFVGRATRAVPAMAGVFVDLGQGGDGFLAVKKGKKPPAEGASIIVRVRRPALGDKGALLDADWRRDLSDEAQQSLAQQAKSAKAPGRLGVRASALETMALRAAPFGVAEIIINRAEALAMLGRLGAPVRLDEKSADARDFGAEIDASFLRVVDLCGGGRMIIDECEGMTVVDIDAGGALESTSARLNDRINLNAAARLFRELSKRGIGGRICVDFLPSSSPAARADLLGVLKKTDTDIYQRRVGRLASDGLFDLTAPRRQHSLLERASEPAPGDDVRPGRRFTLDWRAKAAVAALERRLRRAPSARFSLLASPDIAAYLEQRPWLSRLAERYGARFHVRVEASEKIRYFDVAE